MVSSRQEIDPRPQLKRLDNLILRSAGVDPSALSFEFRPLWQMDAAASATIALQKAQATQIYAGLNLWPAAVTAKLVEAQLAEDGTYPGAEAIFADASSPAPQPTADFDPAQPRDPDGRWTAGGGGGASTEHGAAEEASEGSDPPDDAPSRHAPDGTPVAAGPGTSANPAAPDPAVRAIVRHAVVALAPLLVVTSLRRRALELARELITHLPHGLGGLPPDPPPSAEPAQSGVAEPVPSAGPRSGPPVQGEAGQAGAVGDPYSFSERAEDPVEQDPRAAQKLDNALSDYRTRRYTIGNQTFQFDKAGMRYVLKRHAPEYWNGSRKEMQTFFPEGTSVEHLQDVVADVLGQNRDAILAAPSQYQWNLYGTSGGVRYNVAMYQGRIIHLVPLQ